MVVYNKYLLLFAIYFILTACGGETSGTGSGTADGILSPLPVSRAVVKKAGTEQTNDLIRLMIAAFNAAPGSINLEYLEGYLADGMTMNQLADLLTRTDAFKSPLLYPASLSSQQFASRFVNNLVGGTVNYLDKAGLADAIAVYLDNGGSRGDAVWTVAALFKGISSADPHWGRAATQLSNRIDVAYYYSVTTAQSASDLGTLQAVISSVTDDPATVEAAKNSKPVNLAPSWAYLGITGGNRKVTISWAKKVTKSAVSTKGSYNLYWSLKPGVSKKTGKRITNVTSPYIHTGLTNGNSYYYVVTEVTAGIEGTESLEVSTSPAAAISPAPSGITVAPLDGAVQVALDPAIAATATGYNLYYSTDEYLSNPVRLAKAFGGTTTYRHAPLINGNSYFYVVTAGDIEGEGPQSLPVSAQPLADMNAVDYVADLSEPRIASPNGLSAVAGDRFVNLAWNMPASQVPLVFDPDAMPTQPPVISAFNIYWSNSLITDLAMAERITLPVATPLVLPVSFVHNDGLTNDQTYYYIITAVADKDASGAPLKTADGTLLSFESPAGSQVSVAPMAKAPATPVSLSAFSGAQQVTLAWLPGATEVVTYRIYMSPVAPSQPEELVNPSNLLANSTTASYIHTGLQDGITYYYTVTAVAETESAPAPIVSVSLR